MGEVAADKLVLAVRTSSIIIPNAKKQLIRLVDIRTLLQANANKYFAGCNGKIML